MGTAIGDTLPFAIGIAISPVPIIAVILMLFSSRARVNGPAFLAGWVIGVAAVTTIVLLLADGGDAGSDEGASHTVDVIKIVLGGALLFLAFRQWQRRPPKGEQAPMPGWMKAIDSFTPARALGIGVLLSALNPKNLLMAIGAGASIGQAGLDAGQAVVAVLVFVAIASVTIGGAVGYYLIGGKSAESALDGWKAWLTENNTAVMAVLLLIFGFVLLGKGISGLSA